MEIEVKAPVKDLKTLVETLLRVGGVKAGEFRQMDIYYTHPCRDFSKTDEALRIREENGKTYLTYKGPRLGRIGKSRVEITVEIKNPKALSELLSALGFLEVGRVNKIRTVYKVGEYSVMLDRVSDLGTFVEIECKYEGNIDYKESEMAKFLRSLGVKGSLIRKSYLELILEKKV